MTRRSLVLALALAATACTKEAPTVSFGPICVPPDSADTCTFAATCDAQFIGESYLDVTQTDRLWLVVEMTNSVADSSDSSSGRVNGQDAYLQELRATYAGALALPPTRIRVASTIPAAGTQVVSAFLFEGAGLVPASVAAGATANVVVKVTGHGVFGDGSSFETPPWEVPVKVCSGCVGPRPACPTAGDVLFVCPPNWGQSPASATCAAP
jgi:hypothetical protein